MDSEVESCLKIYDEIYASTHKKRSAVFVNTEAALVNAGKLKVAALDAHVANKQLEKATKAASAAEREAAEKGAEKVAKEVEKKAADKAAKRAAAHAAARKAEGEASKIAAEKAAKRAAAKAVEAKGLQLVAKNLAKEESKLVAKAAAKATAKATAEGATKSVAKKIPVISLAAGGVFGAVRVGCGIYHACKGDYVRASEEAGKAALEVASGACGCFPGVGTVASLAIDGALIAWDIGDGVADARKPKPPKTRLKQKLQEIKNAIDEKTYSTEAFLDCVFTIAFRKLGSKVGDKAEDDAEYIDDMVKSTLDDGIFDGVKFPTEDILAKMAEKGFSQAQRRTFKALAKSRKRD